MAIDERRVQAIVAEVLSRIDAHAAAGPAAPTPEMLGVHADLETAIVGAFDAFRAFGATSLETRYAIVAAIRDTLTANVETLSRLAVEETGLGRVEDKRVKNPLAIDRTPRPADL